MESCQEFKVKTLCDGRRYTVRNHRDKFFFPGQWDKFMEKVKENQKFTFEFLLLTGARINEARNVTVADCDLERKRIILRVTKVKASKGERNSRPRIIPISSKLVRKIKERIVKNDLKHDSYLGILSTPAANIALKKALQRAGIVDYYMFSVHNIRKTLECWLMSLGVDGLKITAHIGHSLSVAAGHYISADVLSWEEKKHIRDIIGDLYENRI